MMEVKLLSAPDPLSEPALYSELANRYLVWDAFVSGERRVDLHPLVLPRALHEDARRAAENVVRTIGHVADCAHSHREESAHYALHQDVMTLSAASRAAGDDALLVRVDLLFGEDGIWHPCEINADCPGGHNEAWGLPRLARAAGYLRGEDPTHLIDGLVSRLMHLAQGHSIGMIFAPSYAEDLQICAILKRRIEELGGRAVFAPPLAPRANDRDELMLRGRDRIGVLYRYFPIEYMAGQPNVADYARAIRAGKLRTLSSMSCVYMQSKLAFARAWAIDPEEAERVRIPYSRAFEPEDATRLLTHRPEWVIKKAFGRVGDEVLVGALTDPAIFAANLTEVAHRVRARESWIVQRFVRQRPTPTPWGPRYVTLGAYVQDGVFTGYFARITPVSHVSHDALVVPVFVEGEMP